MTRTSDKLSSLKPNTTINITAPALAMTPSDKNLTPRLRLRQSKVHNFNERVKLLIAQLSHGSPPLSSLGLTVIFLTQIKSTLYIYSNQSKKIMFMELLIATVTEVVEESDDVEEIKIP